MTLSRRFTASRLRQVLQRVAAVGTGALLLPVVQIDALAQQSYSQYGNNQPQYGSRPQYSQPQYTNNQYVQPAPSYSQPQANPQQPYQDPGQSQYANQYQDPNQNQGQYADQGQYPGRNPVYQPDQPYAQQQPQQPFGSDQLEQLVAPIALYPDTLIAQVLAAATYPAQVVAADHWLQAQGYASPDQIAGAADAQPTWDPSVKALTAFPQVLTMMDRDLQWTTDLGNAYYNQPQDVLQTIQVLRQRAQDAGTLQSTPQEQVEENQGYIQLAPQNPQVVYVPTYNPWEVYGAPIAPYPGFSVIGAIGSVFGAGLRFGAGIGLAAFAHTSFGWMGWALNWLTSSILFHHSPYFSRSTSVAHFGNPGGGYGRGGQFGGRAQPEFRGSNGYGRTQGEFNRPSNGYREQGYAQNYARQPANNYNDRSYERQPDRAQTYAYNRPAAPGYGTSGYGNSYARPSTPNAYNFNRPQAQAAAPYRGYSQYPNPQQSWRPAQPAQQHSFRQNAYENRSYESQSRSYSAYSAPRSFAGTSRSPERSSGFHAMGGNRGGESYHAPKAPKSSGGGHGGGLFHHSGGGGKHR